MQNYMPNGQIPYNKTGTTSQAGMPQYQTPPVQNPNYAGVNIQIINPMVNPNSNGGYIYPQQTNSAYNAGTQGGCYPSNYYTTQPGVTYNPYAQNNPQNGFYDSNGKYYPYVKDGNGQLGYYDDKGQFHPVGGSGNSGGDVAADGSKAEAETVDSTAEESKTAEDKNGTEAANNSNAVDENKSEDLKETEKTSDEDTKKVETSKESELSEASESGKTKKKKVIELSDDYIRTLENYLNSQDVEIRKMGAHEVVNRLAEDKSRNDDPALTALVNKMLQDPSTAIRTIALSLVDSRTVLGDDLTVKLLKNMQNSETGFGLDANQATSALLKMAGKTIEKEVPVDETEKDDKKEK